MRIEYKKYKIENNKNINIKLAHISDIHYAKDYKNKRLEMVREKLTKTSPNYICITGDLIDIYNITKEKDFNYFKNWLIKLTNISKAIISLGNHEYIKKDKNKYTFQNDIKWLEELKSDKLVVLDNNVYNDNNICFIGFNPDHQYYYIDKESVDSRFNININKLIIKGKSKYKILLLHTPMLILKNDNYKKIKEFENLDLILCGHTHGGMLPSWLPGNFGIISPNREILPKKVRGIIKLEKNNVIISSGITKLSRKSKLTFFNDIYGANINEINIISKQN